MGKEAEQEAVSKHDLNHLCKSEEKDPAFWDGHCNHVRKCNWDSVKRNVQNRLLLLFLKVTWKGGLGNILKYVFDAIMQHIELDYKIAI